MSKKTIIILSVVFGLICVVLILFWTLFALSTVEVDFKTTTKNLTLTSDEIVEAGDFSYGACVLFDGKTKYVERLESACSENANFAYLEVVNIETVFPNRYIIHVAEREEVYAVAYGAKYLMCDDDFRVLRVAESFDSTQTNAILVENLTFSNKNVNVGDFLDVNESGMLEFYNSMLSNNRTLTEQCGFVQKITLGTNYVELTDTSYVSATLTTFSGREIVINNIDFALTNKLQLLFALDCSLLNNINENGYLTDSAGNILYDYKYDEDGNILYDSNGEAEQGEAWTYERLASSYVLIDNNILTEFQTTAVTDIYYKLIYQGA